MPLLGRGKPALSATVAISRDYFSRDGGVTIHRMSERPDLGFFNVTFDKGAYPSEPVYATTHGIFKAQGDGEKNHLATPAQNVEATRPTTALACAGLDENPGICLTHPLDPAQPGRVSISIAWAHNWRWQPLARRHPHRRPHLRQRRIPARTAMVDIDDRRSLPIYRWWHYLGKSVGWKGIAKKMNRRIQ